jgi:peptidoglycan/LPS O-acetylase OafA/YrhL
MAVFTVIVFAPDILSFFVKYFKGEEYLSTNIIDAIVVQLKYLACIAVGCLFSFLYFKREGITKKFFFKKSVQIAVVVILLGCIVSGHYIFHSEEMIDYRLYTFLFSIIVLNASQNARTIFKLETRIFNFLGKISYGIYMYHPVCIGASIALSRSVTKDIILQNIVIYFFSIGFTVLVSWLSFEYVESFFLKLKTRFQILRTMEKAESEKVHSTNALLEV